MNSRKITLLLAMFLGVASPVTIARAPDPIRPFLGEYQGHTIEDSAGMLTIHDIGVRITQFDGGFTVEWNMVTRNTNGESLRAH